MDLADALTFARDRRQGVLVTIGAGGRPQLSNILFVPWGDGDDAFGISVGNERVKTRNLRRDPRASLYVLGDNFWQWVVLEGTASLSPVAEDPHDATVDALVEYYRLGQGEHPNWDEYRAAMVKEERLIITVRPERAYGVGVGG
ncbi:MAG TPA: PPOX class F420-dependent oxidoreductase [Acidimicrobiales bacterium]